jgi:hypothetical protein
MPGADRGVQFEWPMVQTITTLTTLECPAVVEAYGGVVAVALPLV